MEGLPKAGNKTGVTVADDMTLEALLARNVLAVDSRGLLCSYCAVSGNQDDCFDEPAKHHKNRIKPLITRRPQVSKAVNASRLPRV
uniref:Uncharacterized protein n=1 Tax=Chromera velia CCMP2878 TaxID=1169474 RepID=A0A0G4ICZ9_9ALVE|eukprot:Cvel_2291.t1-p1 / transcript=Cvel_2291.t1 / gene=Cvel_2291 / organism=Chromera_velia_CCMP2878 / gene_product=Retrotransposable element Tf2 155 kDa protein type, putative / transcript_product=Retrotransposable element Tf2 155 kDa protein type, putative / location=Cvel_scaffold88:132781-133035(+) / protein_length=85 / sequence_SO=supercontig / SO=protein_coding / is_pseudo=false